MVPIENLKHEFRQISRSLAILLLSNFFVSLAKFMTLPFLAIYLHEYTHLSVVQTGFVMGVSPLASTLFGFIGGYLVDKKGARSIYSLALFMNALALPGYILFSNFYFLCIVAVMSGLGWNLYDISSKTRLSQLTSKDRLPIVFSYNYWAFNLGGALGPLIGVFLANNQLEVVSFYAFSSVLIILGIVSAWFISGTIRTENQMEKKLRPSIKEKIVSSLSFITFNKILLYLSISYFFIFFIEAQLQSSLIQYIQISIGEGIKIVGIMLTINTLLVLIFQPIAGHMIHRFNHYYCFIIGGILYSCGPFLFIFTTISAWFWYIGIVVFTFGEICLSPTIQSLVVEISEEKKRGTYFSIIGMGGEFCLFYGACPGVPLA